MRIRSKRRRKRGRRKKRRRKERRKDGGGNVYRFRREGGREGKQSLVEAKHLVLHRQRQDAQSHPRGILENGTKEGRRDGRGGGREGGREGGRRERQKKGKECGRTTIASPS